MKQPVENHRDPLAYLRGCAFEVDFSDGKVVLTPRATMTDTVMRRALRYSRKHRAELMADLAAEEAGSRL